MSLSVYMGGNQIRNIPKMSSAFQETDDTMGTMFTTASMRKTLIGLFLLMGIGVMVVYWNQDGVRPLALVQTVRCDESAKTVVPPVDLT